MPLGGGLFPSAWCWSSAVTMACFVAKRLLPLIAVSSDVTVPRRRSLKRRRWGCRAAAPRLRKGQSIFSPPLWVQEMQNIRTSLNSIEWNRQERCEASFEILSLVKVLFPPIANCVPGSDATLRHLHLHFSFSSYVKECWHLQGRWLMRSLCATSLYHSALTGSLATS